MRRRSLLSLPALAASYPARAQAPLALLTAGPGSAFLPYGEGLAAFLGRQGIPVTVRRTTGSLQNLSMVEDDPNVLGTALLGSAWDTLQGTPAAGGRHHTEVRALFPMYQTSFQAAALRVSGITSSPTSTNGGLAAVRHEGRPRSSFAPPPTRQALPPRSSAVSPRCRPRRWRPGTSTPSGKAQWCPFPRCCWRSDVPTHWYSDCGRRRSRRSCPISRPRHCRPAPILGRLPRLRASAPGTSSWPMQRCRRRGRMT
ncbi:hypothetical protein E2C06_34330 [Dankookia rubra]|uniref:TAXI family TRAP transporter solute-binding subunit n=1 Tax=Dankookia rubra TaxID=1442381 RepID=A0A4R5Q5B8_9PROT|nr:hypothetical protein E2C06_34330 [Dankookia rubra]